MGFNEAVKTCITKYFGFYGRARRSEYWYWVLFTFLLSLVAGILDLIIGTDYDAGGGVLSTIVSLAILAPSLAAGARRLHDTGRTGWWQLIMLIPVIGFFVLLVFFVFDSQEGENKYGPNPKAVTV